MTSCAECLTSLATTRLADFNRESVLVAHCSQCAACAAALSDFQLAERRLALTLSELRPLPPSITVASEAIAGSEKLRRRTAARIFRSALAIIGLVLLGSYVREEIWIKQWPVIITEIVQLQCMSTDDATALVTPFLRSDGASVYSVPGARAITIRGAESEATRAIFELKTFESKYCLLPAPPGADVKPADAGPGKD
jgi:hypothetical protein